MLHRQSVSGVCHSHHPDHYRSEHIQWDYSRSHLYCDHFRQTLTADHWRENVRRRCGRHSSVQRLSGLDGDGQNRQTIVVADFVRRIGYNGVGFDWIRLGYQDRDMACVLCDANYVHGHFSVYDERRNCANLVRQHCRDSASWGDSENVFFYTIYSKSIVSINFRFAKSARCLPLLRWMYSHLLPLRRLRL